MDGTIIFTVLGGNMPTIEQLQNEMDEIKWLTERLETVSRVVGLIPFAMERKYEEPNEHRDGKVLLDVYGPSDEGEPERKEAHVSLTPEQVGLIDEALMKEKRALEEELAKRQAARINHINQKENTMEHATAMKHCCDFEGLAPGPDTADQEIVADKYLYLRRELDRVLQDLKRCPPSREKSLAITKLQEAIMWLGMDLKRLNEPNPYPESYNPTNTKIEPTADGLKL
jgi:hypothetical protein